MVNHRKKFIPSKRKSVLQKREKKTLQKMLKLSLFTLVIIILIFSSLSAIVVVKEVSAQPRGDVSPSHSLEPPFIHDWWVEGIPHWEVGGDAVVTSDYLRLTPNLPSRFGWAWNTVPNEHKWFEAVLTFNIRSKSSPGADGMALWYVEKPHKGRQGSVMGMPPNFYGLGVLLDSYDNDNMRDNPAVAVLGALNNNPQTSWDPESDFARTAMMRCQYDYRRSSSGPNEMIILYHERKLSIRLRPVGGRTETNCGEVNDIELNPNWYFGFTAVTGGVSDNHDVLSFVVRPVGDSIINLEQATSKAGKFDYNNDKREKEFWVNKG
jgi:hypothetical protein